MAGATSAAAVLAPPLAKPEAIPEPPPVEPAAGVAPQLLSTVAGIGIAPGVVDQLLLVVSAAGPGGLSGCSSDQALSLIHI